MASQTEGPEGTGAAGGTGSGHATITDSELRQVLTVLRRRWRMIAAAAILALGAAWWTQRGQVDVYTAEVLLRKLGSRGPLEAIGVAQKTTPEDFGSQIEILRSRVLLTPVVDSLGLRLRLAGEGLVRSRLISSVVVDRAAVRSGFTLEGDGTEVRLVEPGTGAVVARARAGQWLDGPGFRILIEDPRYLGEPAHLSITFLEDAVERLRRQIRVEQVRGTDLLRLRYTHVDPRHAARIVNTLANEYQRHQSRMAREAAGRRRDFMAVQLANVADSLKVAQNLMLDYQGRSQILNPAVEGGVLVSALMQAENEQRTLRFQQSLLEGLVTALRSDSQRQDALDRVLVMGQELLPGGATLYNRLQELEAERRRLTASRFGRTEADANVEVVDSLISATRSQTRAVAEQSLGMLSARRQATENRVRELRSQVGGLPERTAEFGRLQQRVDAVQSIFDLLLEKYYEAQIAEGVESGDVDVIDPAPVPLRPDSSRRGRFLALAAVLGLVVGIFGAFTLEQLDTSVHEPAHAVRAARLPVLAMLPSLRNGSALNGGPGTPGDEAFRRLRTNLRFLKPERPRVLAVTSPAPGEGKSTVAANLALVLAQQGTRVLLVDTDLRRPKLHQIFRIEQRPGLTDVLRGDVDPDAAVHYDDRFGISIMPAGRAVENPAELLGAEEFARFAADARERFEAVIIDTAPVLVVTDGTLVATAADGVLVVARAHQTDRAALALAIAELRHVEARLLGTILNDVPSENGAARYYYYKYRSYYTSDDGGSAPWQERLKSLVGRAT